jgi:hypothetical protein
MAIIPYQHLSLQDTPPLDLAITMSELQAVFQRAMKTNTVVGQVPPALGKVCGRRVSLLQLVLSAVVEFGGPF